MKYTDVLFTIHKYMRPRLYLEIGAKDGLPLQLAFGKTKCLVLNPGYELVFPCQHDTKIVKVTSEDLAVSLQKNLKDSRESVGLVYIDDSLGIKHFEDAIINLKSYCSDKSVLAVFFAQARKDNKPYDFVKVIRESYETALFADLKVDEGRLLLVTNLNGDKKKARDTVAAQNAEDFNISAFGTSKKQRTSIRHGVLRKVSRKPRALGVLLCYNDADILEEAIQHLIANNHQIIAWDHGSDDDTAKVLDKYEDQFVERRFVPREFDFYGLYPAMSQHLIDCFIQDFDWISWPDQDEILEGPDRTKSYYDHITHVFRSKYDWLQFNNFNFWFTEKDDPSISSPVERVKYYSLFPNCAPRVRSWRARVTNIREFNHNPLPGEKFPHFFNLRHYPMRSNEQAQRRLGKDRAAIQRGVQNTHYQAMQKKSDLYKIKSESLHYDDGSELDKTADFDWRSIYFDGKG